MKLHRIFTLLHKYYYITINRVDRIFDILYWPIIDLIIWGFTSAYIKDISDVNLLSMLLGGIILWVFVWRASQDIAVFVLEDFWSRNLYHLFSSPVRLSEHIISIIILGFMRATATFFVLLVLAFLLYSFNILTIPLYYIAISIFLLSLFGWSMGLFVSSLIFRYGKRIQVLAWSIVWIIQPFSCIFYPLSALPGWAAGIARILPTTRIFENLRQILDNGTIDLWGLGYSLIANIVILTAMAFFMHSSFRKAKITGLIAKSD
jgi:ABC-2 type transport system permease protein